MPRNTAALEKFNTAVDSVLAERGVPNRQVFNDNIRRVYNANNLKGLTGWNKAKDMYLQQNLNFPNGYKSLLDEAKKRYANQ